MSDTELRSARRRWQQTRAVEDAVVCLRERVRSGDLPPARVGLAAALGDEAAKRVLGKPPAPLHRDLGEFTSSLTGLGGCVASLRAALAAVLSLGLDETGDLEALVAEWEAPGEAGREAVEDRVRASLGGARSSATLSARMGDETRDLPPARAAARSLRVALATFHPDERRGHVRGWSKTAVGFALDAVAGTGRIWASSRRPVPEALVEAVRAGVLTWALAESGELTEGRSP